jgi:alpha-1,3-rhamnosyl/mannosyltransferase
VTPRVLLFAHRLSHPSRTGVVRYANELAAALDVRAGSEHAYVLSSLPEPWPLPWTPRRIEVRRARGPRRIVNLAWTAMQRPNVERLAGRADLVHALDPGVLVPSHAPFICTVHDLMPLQHPEWFERGPRWALGRAVRHARDHARMIVTVSETVRRDVIELLDVEPDRVRAIPSGIGSPFTDGVAAGAVSEVLRRHGLQPQGYLLYVGTVSVRKNLPTLVRALEVAGAGPLVVAGPDGLGAAGIRAEVQRLGLGNRVRFMGFVAEGELPALMAGSSGLCHPATYEGFGFTPLEAMAMGTPVVVSRGGALPEVVGDAGLIVDPDDVDGWASAIRSLDDPSIRSRLVEAGSRQASRYTWSRTADATVRLHAEVLAG